MKRNESRKKLEWWIGRESVKESKTDMEEKEREKKKERGREKKNNKMNKGR